MRDISIEQVSFVMTEASDSRSFRAHGVAVCTLSVSNISTVTRTVRLSASADPYASMGLIDYQQSCTLAPGAAALVCFKFLPMSSMYQYLRIAIDGVQKGDITLSPFPWGFVSRGDAAPVIFLSPSLPQTAVKYRANNLFAQLKGSFFGDWTFLDGFVPVAEWPDQWLAYTPADCVVLTKEEWETAPPAVRNALLGFIQAGGGLVLAGATMEEVAHDAFPVGFGAVRALSSPVPEEWTERDFHDLQSAATNPAARWEDIRYKRQPFPTSNFFSPPSLFPVYVLLLGIMIFLGPVLLAVLARRNIRIRIYWLAPCIAGAVSVVILLFALFRDGVSPITSAQSVLYLNGKTHTFVQLSELSIMAPAGLSSSLHFGPSVEVMPASREDSLTGKRSVKNGDELVLNNGWVSARIPATFLLRDTGALDIPMLSPDASAKVTNPYPVPIRRLLYCDGDGNCFALDAPLAPGETTQLTLYPDVSGTMLHIVEDMKDTFYGLRPLTYVSGSYLALPPRHLLPPGMYLCEFEGTPFLQHPLRKGNVRHTGSTLMLGELP